MNCLNPNHKPKAVYARGLCFCCYNSARRLIKKGATTWEKMVESGRALESKSRKGAIYLTKTTSWLINQ